MKQGITLILCLLFLFLTHSAVQAAEMSNVWKYRAGNSPFDEIPDMDWLRSAMEDVCPASDPSWKR